MHGMDVYQKETFFWLAFGLLMISLRIGTRVWVAGLKGFHLDDYLIIIVGGLFATESILSFCISLHGTNNVPPEMRALLTDEMVQKMIYGSKLLYGGWFVYFLLLWIMKVVMICFYQRLTLGLYQAIFLRYISWFVAASAIAIIFTLVFTCWPINLNWQVVPDPGVKCTQGWAYFAVTGIPNILSEIFLLCIPLPLLFRVKMPLSRKIPLIILFSLGIFIILATALRHAAIFSNIYDPRKVTIWATREAFTSIAVGCITQLKPIYDFIIRKLTGTIDNVKHSRSGSIEGHRRKGSGDSDLSYSSSEKHQAAAFFWKQKPLPKLPHKSPLSMLSTSSSSTLVDDYQITNPIPLVIRTDTSFRVSMISVDDASSRAEMGIISPGPIMKYSAKVDAGV